jgi:hypothetical protein
MDAYLHKCDDTDFDDKNSPHVKYVVLHGCGLELVDDIYRRPYPGDLFTVKRKPYASNFPNFTSSSLLLTNSLKTTCIEFIGETTNCNIRAIYLVCKCKYFLSLITVEKWSILKVTS